MSKKMNVLTYILTALVMITSTHSSPQVIQTSAQEVEVAEIQAEIYPKAISHNENAVVSIELPDGSQPTEVTIDASEIGGSEALDVDTDLMEQTIWVKDTANPGNKTLTIQAVDEAGESSSTEVQVEVLPREKTDESDFDWDEAVIYFLLTDRFMDGDSSNNNPNGENYDTNHAETYHGGDFQGVIDRLDYLDELGINTIWITPIVDNVDHNHRHGKVGAQYGYHGYWAKNFTQIDEHLGDLETFKTLIEEAHDRGIKIMVDVVINHAGYGMKMSDSGENVPNFPTPEEQAVFEGMLREDPLDGHDVLGEIYGLPDFITEEPDVRNQIINWQTEWLERARTERGDTIDYFRVDTIKHVDETTLNAFKNELTKVKPDFKLIGENWGASYNNTGGYLNSGQVDSLLDFDFKRVASLFANGNIEQAEAELQKRNATLDNTATVGHFLSSHDEDGFLHYFMQGDEDLFKVAVSLQLTAKGQPVIYYGEEIGLSGKAEGDMDQGEFSENRPDFDWELVEDHHLVDHYQKLLAAREKHSKAFAKGDREHLAGTNEDGYSVFSRTFEDDIVYVALNTSSEVKEASVNIDCEPGTVFVDEYTELAYEVTENQTLDITIPSYADGGTVILAITEDGAISDSTSNSWGLPLVFLTAGVGALVIWRYESGFIERFRKNR